MSDVMSKNYLMKFSDGSTWAVPVSTIAIHRAGVYAPEHGGDIMLSLNNDTLPLFKGDPSEIQDWAKNNMNWVDVADEAVKVYEAKSLNFEQEWLDCDVVIK